MGTEIWIISLPLSDSILCLKIIHPPNFREEPYSELQSLEVTGNHPYFHKTPQNSQNPPLKDAFSIYSMSNLSQNLFSRVKSALKRKFSFKIELYHLLLITQRSPGDYNRKTRRSNSIFRIMPLNILPDYHLITYKDKKQ